MYRTLVLQCEARSPNLTTVPGLAWTERIGPTLGGRPTEFFAAYVRNVSMDATVPTKLVRLVLSKCTGIENLALWHRRKHWKKYIIPLAPTLRTLFTHRPTFNDLAESGVVFPHLTYIAALFSPNAIHLPRLEWAPALTTVRFDVDRAEMVTDDQWIEDMNTVLSTVSRLQRLALDVHERDEEDVLSHLKPLEDGRIIVRDDSIGWNTLKEWRKAWNPVDSGS